MAEYSRDQLWELYEMLPNELKTLIFSEETTNKIEEICKRYGIEDEKQASGVAKYTGRVLLGILPPEDLEKEIEKLGAKREVAKSVSLEIKNSVFAGVKESLAVIYGKTGAEKKPAPKKKTEVWQELKEEKPQEEKMREKPHKSDVYREPIE